MSQFPVAAWSLKSTNSTPAESSFAITPSVSGGTGETSLRDDSRKPVKPSDIQPGGKYYSIVKLQIRYEGQDSSDTRYAQGTGWLIQPDLLVTAGHCAFDQMYSLGKAVEVKAYLGYNGKASIGKPGVQFRNGSRIVTTTKWIASDVNRANDVSFIQLNKGFDNAIPFVWKATPEKGQAVRLGVVGYPADKTLSDEPGAQMYEMFVATTWDLSASASHMLEYKISTYAGQSGSPVVVDGANGPPVSYGAHVYGLGTKNSASVIKGMYGNNYKSIISAFNKPFPRPGADVASILVDGEEFNLGKIADTFSSVFSKVVQVGAAVAPSILAAGTPFLGPAGPKIAAAVGAGLSIANQLVNKKGAESSLEDTAINYRDHASRAILAEAAFQALINMDAAKAKPYLQKIKAEYTQKAHQIGPIAKKLGPVLLEPALRIAVEDAAVAAAPKTESSLAVYPIVGDPSAADHVQNKQHARFITALTKPAESSEHEPEFFGFLSALAPVALKAGSLAVSAIGSLISGQESSLDSDDVIHADSVAGHMETLCHRALLADATLNALIAAPPESHEEGFFDGLINTVKSIGSTVVKVAPSVLNVVSSLVQESSLQPAPVDGANGQPDGTGETNLPLNGVPKKKKSTLFGNITDGNFADLD